MRATVKLMPNALMDRVCTHPGDSPEILAIRNENTPENQGARQRATETDDMEEKIRHLLDEEFAALKPVEKQDLAAYWTDCWQYSRDQVSERLQMTENDVGVAKWRALGKHPCGNNRGRCEGVAGCAHGRGKALWATIIRRVASKLGFQDGGEA